MLYIIGLIRRDSKPNGSIIRYKLFDTLSESYMNATPNKIKRILSNQGTQVANAKLHNNIIEIHDWVNNIVLANAVNRAFINAASESIAKCDFIMLAQETDTYKIIRNNGDIIKVPLEILKALIDQGTVANCSISNNQITSTDTYEISTNEEFEKDIAIKYESFKLKAPMLGYGKVSFEYEIENQQVKLKSYTGSSKNVLLPSFITAIMQNAFMEAAIDTIDLNEGLRAIGAGAFSRVGLSDGLSNIEIPSTVEIIGKGAFSNNNKMMKNNGGLDMTKLKLRNSNTIVMDKFE